MLLQSDDFETVAARLKHAELKVADFEVRIDAAREGDFIFLDPPYTVAHNLNGFVKYNEELFSWGDQVRLQRAVTRARVRGVRFFSLTQTTTQYATYTRHLTARVY